jgi:hypothetical protein
MAMARSDGVGAEKDNVGQDKRDRKGGDRRPYMKEGGSTDVILTAIMCTAASVMVLSSMDALGLVRGVDDDYNNDDGASLAEGRAECAEANGPSVNGRWRRGQEVELPADRKNQTEDKRDAARGVGATRGRCASGRKAVAL